MQRDSDVQLVPSRASSLTTDSPQRRLFGGRLQNHSAAKRQTKKKNCSIVTSACADRSAFEIKHLDER